MKVILALGALLLICGVMSSRKQRAEARQRMKRYEPIAWAILAAELLLILWPWNR